MKIHSMMVTFVISLMSACYVTTVQASVQTLTDGGDLTNAVAIAQDNYVLEKTLQVIVLGKGTYKTEAEINLDFPVVIRGATGNPADVIVEAQAVKQSKIYRVFTVNYPQARIESITITGGRLSPWGGNNYYNYGCGFRIAAPLSATQPDHSKQGDGGVVTNCVVTGNEGDRGSSGKYCGAVACFVNATDAHVTHCIITNNFCSRQLDANYTASTCSGGAVHVTKGRISNSLIAYNTVQAPDLNPKGTPADISQVVNIGASGVMENCAVVHNTLGVSYNPAVVKAAAGGKVINTVIASNTVARHSKLIADWPESATCWSGTVASYTNCAMTVATVPNDTCLTTSESDFFDLANDDLRLTRTSRLRSAGTTTGVTEKTTDLAGRARLNDDGSIDIGPYAYNPDAQLIKTAALPADAFDTEKFSFGVTTCEGFGATPTYIWRFSDGTTSVAETVTHDNPLVTLLPAGNLSVTLVVSNELTGATYMRALGSLRCKQKYYYVVSGNANAKAPYASLLTAAADIQTAIDAAADEGAEVLIDTGLYEITTSIFLKKVITVRGKTGNPEDVIIRNVYTGSFGSPDNTGHGRCCLIDAGEEAMLSSVVLEDANVGGTYTLCGALYIGKDVTGTAARGTWFQTGNGGCVSNVVIRNAKNSNKFGHATALCAVGTNARVTHCTITNNTSSAGFGNGGSQQGIIELEAGAQLEHCLVADNRSVGCAGVGPSKWPEGRLLSAVDVRGTSKVRFCTIVSNVCSLVGGVNVAKDAGARVEDCLVMCNHAIESVDYYSAATTRHDDWGFFNLSRDNDVFKNTKVELGQGIMADALAAEITWVNENAATVSSVFNTTYTDHAKAGDTGLVCVPTSVFRNPSKGKWALCWRSPARDVVDPAAVENMPGVDLAGHARLVNGKYDLGCHEAARARGSVLMFR